MSELSEQDFKSIIARRDGRYDGRFYFGVKTTRIYCRPVCPAHPKPENIIIFRSLTEAENNGYRSCLRCRPDLAPGSKLLDGTMNTVSRALRIIQSSAATELTIERLADSLGVTGRHLRRLFDQHLGASPVEIMITQRLHLAKQLLLETTTPIAEIGLAVGFQSIRRFNEAFKASYRQTPSALRVKLSAPLDAGVILRVPLRLPYDSEGVFAYLKRHETYGVERAAVGLNCYERFVPQIRGPSFGTIRVTAQARQAFLKVQFIDIPLQDVRRHLTRIKSLFDTDHNPKDLPEAAAFLLDGIRVPTGFDAFETAVSIIMGQVVSTVNAKTLMKKLVQRYGRLIAETEDGPIYEFPSPQLLCQQAIEEIGITKTKADAIRGLASALIDGTLDFEAHLDFTETARVLLAIRGIGPWTAAMIGMRCLADPDAFPANDLLVRRALEKKLVEPKDWGSSRAYLVHYLWRNFGEELSKVKTKKTREKSAVPINESKTKSKKKFAKKGINL